jgi:hypothetical protein
VETSGAHYLSGHGETFEDVQGHLRHRGYLPLFEAAASGHLTATWLPPRLTQADYDFLEGCSVRIPSEPAWPLTVHFDQHDVVVLHDLTDAETELEFFDSEDPEEPVPVLDALGRRVHIVVHSLQVVACSLKL